jgi:hypothetical protein
MLGSRHDGEMTGMGEGVGPTPLYPPFLCQGDRMGGNGCSGAQWGPRLPKGGGRAREACPGAPMR